jgi:hypothetical protein
MKTDEVKQKLLKRAELGNGSKPIAKKVMSRIRGQSSMNPRPASSSQFIGEMSMQRDPESTSKFILLIAN